MPQDTIIGTAHGVDSVSGKTLQAEEVHSSGSQGTTPIKTRLGFKLGQTGTFSTMEFGLEAVGHHRDGDTEHRKEIAIRDTNSMFEILDALADRLNAARAEIGQYVTWHPSGAQVTVPPPPPMPPPAAAPPPAATPFNASGHDSYSPPTGTKGWP